MSLTCIGRTAVRAMLLLVAFGLGGVTVPVAAQDSSGDLILNEPWTGDFDGMVERNVVRVLTVYSKTFYFLDRATQRGLSYELLKTFEKEINEQLERKHVKIHVVFLPVSRDRLIPALVEGLGDLAVANLTITPERQKRVDFSDPMWTGVSEVVVTGPGSPAVSSVDDLAGQTVHVRPSSSYYESLVALNDSFRQAGKPEMKLVHADEIFEDEDLLEMVNAGLIPIVIVDSHKADFWAQVFDGITVHSDVAVRTGGQIAWAFRKNSPELAEVVNAFVKGHKKGSLLGNVFIKRYLKNTRYVRNSTSEAEMKKFGSMVDFLKKYSEQYGFDYLLVGALAYQESQLDQSKRSHVGAVGVMQILPKTASDPNVGIPEIEDLEPNIHAGVKYLHFVHNRYFKDTEASELDQWLFTFASYNAGPAKVRKLRQEAAEMGLDPDVWFGNVEMAAAKRIGRETVQYVSNIYKYYIAYTLIVAQHEAKKAAAGATQ